MTEKKAIRIVNNETGETVETLQMSERGLDGLYQKIDFERFHIEEDDE